MILFSPPFRRASCASRSPTSNKTKKKKKKKKKAKNIACSACRLKRTNSMCSQQKQTDKQANGQKNNNNKESLSVDAQSCTAESRKPGRHAQACTDQQWVTSSYLASLGFLLKTQATAITVPVLMLITGTHSMDWTLQSVRGKNTLSKFICKVRDEALAQSITPSKGIQDSLGFWIPHCGFSILCQWNFESGFQSLVRLQIPRSKVQNSGFHNSNFLDSYFSRTAAGASQQMFLGLRHAFL